MENFRNTDIPRNDVENIKPKENDEIGDLKNFWNDKIDSFLGDDKVELPEKEPHPGDDHIPHKCDDSLELPEDDIMLFRNLNKEVSSDNENQSETEDSTVENEKSVSELTQEERDKIKEETGWSDEIIDYIKNMKQYEIYKKADLVEKEINGRKCLVKRNLDLDYVDKKTGLTNRELMAQGKSPYDAKTGERIELHHMGQDADSPFAELCEKSEHGDGNDKILHDSDKPSWRRDKDLKNKYNNIEKPNHWKERSK